MRNTLYSTAYCTCITCVTRTTAAALSESDLGPAANAAFKALPVVRVARLRVCVYSARWLAGDLLSLRIRRRVCDSTLVRRVVRAELADLLARVEKNNLKKMITWDVSGRRTHNSKSIQYYSIFDTLLCKITSL